MPSFPFSQYYLHITPRYFSSFQFILHYSSITPISSVFSEVVQLQTCSCSCLRKRMCIMRIQDISQGIPYMRTYNDACIMPGMYTYLHIIYMYIYIYTCICISTSTSAYTYTYTYVCRYVCMYVCIHTYTYTHVCIQARFLRVHVCVYVCVYVNA